MGDIRNTCALSTRLKNFKHDCMSGLIPQTFIDDILARTDIIDVISENITLKKAGRNYQARCPFHQEKTPSFTANHEKQFYYCFGCGAAGNAINFVMNYQHIDFPAAVEVLAQKLGLNVLRTQDKDSQERSERLNPLYTLSKQATEFYQQQYTSHSEHTAAKNYLLQRGLTDETIARFDIGYAPSGWNNLLNHLSKQTYNEKQLEESGLIVKHETRDNLYDRFRKRIIFPIRDLRGRVIGFGGRSLGDEKPKYLNSPETPIFHKGRELYGLYEAKQAHPVPERLIVVEGYMDVVALAQHGINNAVATLGTATTTDHINKLFRYTSEIAFCFDGDTAGKKAAWRALETTLPAMKDGRRARFLFLPQGEDPDSLVFQKGADYFHEQITRHSETLDQYLFNHLASAISMHTLDGKAQFARQAQHYIQQLPEGAYRELLINEVAKHTELGNRIINDLMLPAEKATPEIATHEAPFYEHSTPSTSPNYNTASRQYSHRKKVKPTSARLAIRILLKFPALAEKIPLGILRKDENRETQLLVTLTQFLQTSPAKSQSAIRGSWHNTALGEEMTEIQLLTLPDEDPEPLLLSSVNKLVENIRKAERSTRPARERLQDAKAATTTRKIHHNDDNRNS